MTLNGFARLVAAAELPAFVAIAPMLLFPTPRRLLVLLLVPPIWICARIATGRLVPPGPLNVALSLLLATVGLSLWTTFDLMFSLGKVSGVLLGVLLYWAVVRWTNTRARLGLGVTVMVCAGALLAVVGLLGTQWSDKFPMFGPVIGLLPKVIRGVPGADEGFNPNAVAGSLVLFLPLQVALLSAGPLHVLRPGAPSQRRRGLVLAAQWSALLLTSGTVLLLQSRGAWFGLVVAAAGYLLWRNRWSRVLVLAAGLVAVVALGSGGVSGLVVSGNASGVGGITQRVQIWSRAIDGIQDFAFTGMGMNTFRKVMPILYPTSVVPPTMDVAHAHNQLLVTALDLGVLGLMAYVAICLLIGVSLVVACRSAGDRPMRAIAGGLGMGLLAHFVFGMTDAIPLGAKVGVVFWLALGLVTALHRIVVAPPGEPAAGGSRAA